MEKKKQVMAVSMSSEINVLARELNRISEMNRRTRDFTLNSLRRALVGFIALFPVYRTYVSAAAGLDERDAHYIQWTIARAQVADPTTNASLFQWLEDVLLKRYPEHLPIAERQVMLHGCARIRVMHDDVEAFPRFAFRGVDQPSGSRPRSAARKHARNSRSLANPDNVGPASSIDSAITPLLLMHFANSIQPPSASSIPEHRASA